MLERIDPTVSTASSFIAFHLTQLFPCAFSIQMMLKPNEMGMAISVREGAETHFIEEICLKEQKKIFDCSLHLLTLSGGQKVYSSLNLKSSYAYGKGLYDFFYQWIQSSIKSCARSGTVSIRQARGKKVRNLG